MHSTSSHGVTFHHNGDFSGRIYLRKDQDPAMLPSAVCTFDVLAAAVLQHPDVPGSAEVELTVDAEDSRPAPATGSPELLVVSVPIGALRDLVGNRIVNERIAALEDADPEQVCLRALGEEVLAWSQGA